MLFNNTFNYINYLCNSFILHINKLQTITRRFIQSKILLEPNKYLHLNNIPCNCLIPEFSVKNTNSNKKIYSK